MVYHLSVDNTGMVMTKVGLHIYARNGHLEGFKLRCKLWAEIVPHIGRKYLVLDSGYVIDSRIWEWLPCIDVTAI